MSNFLLLLYILAIALILLVVIPLTIEDYIKLSQSEAKLDELSQRLEKLKRSDE